MVVVSGEKVHDWSEIWARETDKPIESSNEDLIVVRVDTLARCR